MRALAAVILAVSAALAPAEGRADGLAAWERIAAVATHPRCTNCHVGSTDVPMWEGLGYGAGRSHGMGVRAGESRVGAESVPCRACHITSERPNNRPHAAPRVAEAWRLPPPEMGWRGGEAAALCRLWQGEEIAGADGAELIAHIQGSPFVAWGFAPGGGRSPAPGGLAAFLADVTIWVAAGRPCP